jgi:hypothetical protein
MSVSRFSALTLAVALALAGPSAALSQAPSPAAGEGALWVASGAETSAPAATSPRAAAGPTAESAAVGVRPALASEEPVPAPQARRNLGQARALMIVGAATFLAGALIGGDAGTIIMIGGAGIGLWGLYYYLR